MKIVVAALVCFSLTVSLLKAGSVYFTTDQPEVHGKLTLNGSAIHVDGSSAPDIDLADVLEADLGDGDFHLDYFSSSGTATDKLPPNWQGQDIGHADVPGSYTYAQGTLSLTGTGGDINSAKDRYYYLSRPWIGNGEWTIHIKELGKTEAGLMLRENLDPSAPMFGFGTRPVRPDGGGNGLRHNRNNAGDGSQWNAMGVPEPFWLRVRRSQANFDIALSSDGKTWGNIEQDGAKFPLSFQAGLFITSNAEKTGGKAVMDHVLFTPLQAEPETLPAGVVLCDGTFLAGSFDELDPKNGVFMRMGQIVALNNDKVASAIFDPVTLQQLAKVDAKTGVLMQNGDFAESPLKLIQGRRCDMTSTILGDKHYDSPNVLACVLRAIEPMSSDYEVRLKDGSDIRASGISAGNGQLAINDVSGLTVMADIGEVAQIRAGPALVQTLIDLSWQATPASAPATDETSAVQCWQGNNQEQIMMVAPGTSIDFPLDAKFRALALKIALSPDAPPGSQATVRILADGQEVGRTHPLKTGEQPRFVQLSLQLPKTLTLVADPAGAKVLYIDPVAIRK